MINADKEIVFFGLKRSGHHAVIDWHIHHASCDLVFVNNIRPHDRLIDNLARAIKADNKKAYRIKPTGIWDIESVQSMRWPLLIYNIEAASNSQLASYRVFRDRARSEETAPESKHVLVLRDPLNNFASIARRRTAFRQSRMDEWIDTWIEQATGLISSDDELHDIHGRLSIRFTGWNLDAAYRERIATELSLVGSSLPAEVTAQGGGSSFSGLNSDFLLDRSVLLKRWKTMQNRPEFYLFFRDPEFAAVAQRYYDAFSYPAEMTQAVEKMHDKAKSYPWLSRQLRILKRSWPISQNG